MLPLAITIIDECCYYKERPLSVKAFLLCFGLHYHIFLQELLMTDATFLAPEVVKITHNVLQKVMKTNQLEFPYCNPVLAIMG